MGTRVCCVVLAVACCISSAMADPRVAFTYVPPYKSNYDLRGRVYDVNPDSYKIAVYIFVEGSGWWTKPTDSSPLTAIHGDTWSCDITTGGNDAYATRISAFRWRSSLPAVILHGAPVLPSYFDSLVGADTERVVGRPYVLFSGYKWWVKGCQYPIGPPGEGNYFSDSSSSVWVDSAGQLHLTIIRRGSTWWCSEVICASRFGWGEYVFSTVSPVGALDKNVVNGLFLWDSDTAEAHRETDIEFSRWREVTDSNAQYVVQPFNADGTRHRWVMSSSIDSSTHSFNWLEDSICFVSHEGLSSGGAVLDTWRYRGSYLKEPGEEYPRMNVWLAGGHTAPPSDSHNVEVVIHSFTAPGTRSHWVEMESMPGSPSNVPVKDGAWLAYDSSRRLVYAGKGNNSSDFYSYNNTTNAWASLRAIPLGPEAKLPRQGACGVGDGSGHVYMAKGNNTLGFWRYDVASDSWLRLADVPAGGSSRRLKAGSGAVYVRIGDSGFVYLLKGPTCEFYRFNVAAGTWQTLTSAPAGSHSKWYDGSFLVFDGGQTIYAHKASYNELWAYDVQSATWRSTQLNGMPFVGGDGRRRKAGGGSAGAWLGSGIYALKGGSTGEFWRYDAPADAWTEFSQLPLSGNSGDHRVSAGGSIVDVNGTLYALKGNRTRELWRNSLVSPQALQMQCQGVREARTGLACSKLAISPNPLASRSAVLRYSLPKAGIAAIGVFDVAGRAVLSQTLAQGRTGTARVDVGRLGAGVYMVRITAEGFSTTQKLVVEH
jgi:N-acetylneuraminic acid mutarotase